MLRGECRTLTLVSSGSLPLYLIPNPISHYYLEVQAVEKAPLRTVECCRQNVFPRRRWGFQSLTLKCALWKLKNEMLAELASFEHSCGLGSTENKLACLYHTRIPFSFGGICFILVLVQQPLPFSPTDQTRCHMQHAQTSMHTSIHV